MNDALEELIKRLTSRCEASVYDGEPAEAVKDMLRALTPEDFDVLLRQLGFVVARDVGPLNTGSRFDPTWNECREAMLNWREAENSDEQ